MNGLTEHDQMDVSSHEFIGQTVYVPGKTKIGSISDQILSKYA
jgi:hypothetical protein